MTENLAITIVVQIGTVLVAAVTAVAAIIAARRAKDASDNAKDANANASAASKHAAAAVDQVANAHTVNLRDDLDAKVARLLGELGDVKASLAEVTLWTKLLDTRMDASETRMADHLKLTDQVVTQVKGIDKDVRDLRAVVVESRDDRAQLNKRVGKLEV